MRGFWQVLRLGCLSGLRVLAVLPLAGLWLAAMALRSAQWALNKLDRGLDRLFVMLLEGDADD